MAMEVAAAAVVATGRPLDVSNDVIVEKTSPGTQAGRLNEPAAGSTTEVYRPEAGHRQPRFHSPSKQGERAML